MIKKIVLAVMLAAGLSSSAFAQATFTAKDAAGSTQTFKSFNCSANICSLSVPADITGAAFGVTANPFFVVNSGTFATQAAQSGTWNITNISGTISLPTGASTSALQGTNTATTAHTCSVAGYSELGCLGQIDDDVKGPIPAGTNLIGKVGIDQTTPGTTNAVQANVASGGIASGAIASGAVASGAFASGSIASGAFAAGSFVNATAGDPCMFQAKTNVAISTASGTTALVTGVSAKKIYVCSLSLIAPSAVSISLSEGSSSTCGTSNQAAVIGVATSGTAANGMPLAANGGLTLGNGGGTVAATATAANYLCLFQSGTAQLAGNLTFVQQ